jgi:predicted permease
MEGTIHDLRFGVRTLWRNPGFTLIAVVTLALGIGANAAMLSVTRAVLFRDLPYQDPDRAIVVWRQTDQQTALGPVSIPTFRDLIERNRSFEHLAMFRPINSNLSTTDGKLDRVGGLMVSAEFLQALGIEPLMGRGFVPGDDRPGAERTLMVSHGLWQRQLGGTPDVLGRSLRLDGETYTVIAVLPPGLENEPLGFSPLGDFWTPIGLFFDLLPVEERASRPALLAIGRLKPDVTAKLADADLAKIAEELSQEHPQSFRKARLTGTSVRDEAVRGPRPAVWILLAAAGVILLIACANLLHLVLTRATLRDQELATRNALGAGRWRLLRQLLTESTVLALLGGAAGLMVAFEALKLLPQLLVGIPHAGESRIDPQVIGLTLVLTLAASVLIGLVPALQATRPGRHHDFGHALVMRTLSSPRNLGLRQALIVFELAVTLVSLVGAGLLLGTLARLHAQDPGVDTERVLTLQLDLPKSKYPSESAWPSFFDELLTQIRALPGVEDAALTSRIPLDDSGDFSTSKVAAEDRPLPAVADMASGLYQMVSPSYFRTMGIPFLAGRDLDLGDDDRREAERIVVISESLAEHLWPGQDPIGRAMAFEFRGTPNEPEPQWRRVVGVVGEVRSLSLKDEPPLAVYASYTQKPLWLEKREFPAMSLLIKASGAPLDLVEPIRSRLHGMDPQIPIYNVRTMSQVVELQLENPRTVSVLLTSLAALALLLAVVGIYGVVSFTVAARTREIGVRMALGATPRQILGQLVKQSAVLLAAGLAIGLLAASSLTRLMSTLIYGIEALDPLIVLVVASILTAAALSATLIPARRAMRVSPSQALRYE